MISSFCLCSQMSPQQSNVIGTFLKSLRCLPFLSLMIDIVLGLLVAGCKHLHLFNVKSLYDPAPYFRCWQKTCHFNGFQYITVNARRKKYAFSNENALVWAKLQNNAGWSCVTRVTHVYDESVMSFFLKAKVESVSLETMV